MITKLATPAVAAGVMQVMDVLLFTVGLVQAVPPKVTVAPEINPVPVRVMVVPAANFPFVGLTEVIVGKAL